ncbi:MAG TPA: hypothetical protein PKB11_00825 [Desulfovibrio sp.]|uniref:hypothetical protein n=1 Tax=Desulfovibrio sp. TaxID=885 RepID=UPI002BEDDAF1|nr:hypothetical protein [Desulfovibrio sp.]HMM37277.1 hypothetical protein [Desulfovibrio sp.]
MEPKTKNVLLVFMLLFTIPFLAAPLYNQDGTPFDPSAPPPPRESNAVIKSYEQNNTFIIKQDNGDKFYVQIVSGSPNWSVGERIYFLKEREPSISSAVGIRKAKVIVWD